MCDKMIKANINLEILFGYVLSLFLRFLKELYEKERYQLFIDRG